MAERTRYQRNIAGGLQRAFASAASRECDRAPGEIRYVVFSDHHRGGRASTDDFRLCERAYVAALGYYLEKGFTLLALGDVEELWAGHIDRAVASYPAAIELEREFHAQNRYVRFFGNHDDLWSSPHNVERHLAPQYGGELEVLESMRVRIHNDGRQLGTLFFTHGHQGEFWSDRHGHLVRWGAQKFLHPYKRLTRTAAVTPATDNRLRKRHNIAMYLWAAGMERMVLIAGHTHKPVFLTEGNTDEIADRLEERRGDPSVSRDEIARDRAELEWIRAQQRLRCYEVEEELRPLKPCYFNAGCCSFRDGDVTGLEIAEGQVRLVRWPDDHKRPISKVLAEVGLRDVFAQLATGDGGDVPCV